MPRKSYTHVAYGSSVSRAGCSRCSGTNASQPLQMKEARSIGMIREGRGAALVCMRSASEPTSRLTGPVFFGDTHDRSRRGRGETRSARVHRAIGRPDGASALDALLDEAPSLPSPEPQTGIQPASSASGLRVVFVHPRCRESKVTGCMMSMFLHVSLCATGDCQTRGWPLLHRCPHSLGRE